MNNNAETIINAIYSRRSIRKYLDKPIDDGDIKTILSAAMAAPSAGAKDPWRFIVVRNKKSLEKIAEGLPNGKMLTGAACGIVICGDISAAHDSMLSYMLQDCSAAVENMLIAVNALGLGAVWLGVHPREDRIEHLKKLLGLPEPVIPVSVLSIGYPAEKKEQRTRYNESSIHHERWQQK